MSTKDSRLKITYNGVVKMLVEEAKKKDNCEITVAFTGIMHTGKEAEELAKRMLAVRSSVTHECIEKESPEMMKMLRRVKNRWSEHSIGDNDPILPEPDNLILDETIMSVYFLDDMGLLRFLGTDSIPYYVFIDPEGNPNHIHPEVVYIPEEGEVIKEGQEPPKGYMFIAAPECVSEQVKERNKNFRDNLNGGAN